MAVAQETVSHSTADSSAAPLFQSRRNYPSRLCLCNINRSAFLRACSCCFFFLLVLLQTRTCEGRRLCGSTSNSSVSTNSNNIAMCFFRTGDAARDGKLTPFYVPVSDKYMYQEGVRDYLQKMGASAEQLSVVCEEMKGDTEVKCELCLYNEISADQKHVRQGQVLDSMLLQCMHGIFDQATVMERSEYHPICYPRPQQRAARGLPARTEDQAAHATAGEPAAAAAEKDRRQPQRPQQERNGGTCSSTGKSDRTEEQARRQS
eukprot:XP_028343240.1 uncharacterized protein LOC114485644 [Physeter catodon]